WYRSPTTPEIVRPLIPPATQPHPNRSRRLHRDLITEIPWLVGDNLRRNGKGVSSHFAPSPSRYFGAVQLRWPTLTASSSSPPQPALPILNNFWNVQSRPSQKPTGAYIDQNTTWKNQLLPVCTEMAIPSRLQNFVHCIRLRTSAATLNREDLLFN